MMEPRNLVLDFTRECNSHCKSCDIWRDQSDPVILELEYIEKLFQQYRPGYVFVTGGEPFLHDSVVEIAHALKRANPTGYWGGATNCIDSGTERRIASIRDAGVGISVDLSLEGNEAEHDKARGIRGNYRRVMEVRNFLIASGIPYIFASTTPEGLAEGRALGEGNKTHYNSPRGGPRFGGKDTEDVLGSIPNCQGGHSMIVCTPKGDIYACEVYKPELKLGNIKEQDLAAMRWDEVRAYVESGACNPCSMSCWFPR
jgi:MoaA/NifB/PqqE/SkfB family radical SAM enzyme